MRHTMTALIECSGARGAVGQAIDDRRALAWFPDVEHVNRFLTHVAGDNLWWPPAQRDWTPPPEPKLTTVTVELPDRHPEVRVTAVFNPNYLAATIAA